MIDSRYTGRNWWLTHRRNLLRCTAAGFLWIIILFNLLLSIRTLGLTEGVVADIRSGSVTPEQASLERAVGEAAKAYAVEWLTFNDDHDDYARRMAPYGTFQAPAGEQTVDYIGIESISRMRDSWRVNVDVHLTRFITVESSEKNIPLHKVVREYSANNRQMTVYCDSLRESYQLAIQEGPQGLEVIGTPVLLASSSPGGCELADFIDDDEYSDDFSIFIQQVIPMYYRGDDLANYLAEGSDIEAASGYETGRIKILKYESRGETARAVVGLQLIDRGTILYQQMLVEARRQDQHWLLIRLGGY